jgi:hypothetical protein
MALNNAFDSAGTESRAEVEEARKKIRKEEEEQKKEGKGREGWRAGTSRSIS